MRLPQIATMTSWSLHNQCENYQGTGTSSEETHLFTAETAIRTRIIWILSTIFHLITFARQPLHGAVRRQACDIIQQALVEPLFSLARSSVYRPITSPVERNDPSTRIAANLEYLEQSTNIVPSIFRFGMYIAEIRNLLLVMACRRVIIPESKYVPERREARVRKNSIVFGEFSPITVST